MKIMFLCLSFFTGQLHGQDMKTYQVEEENINVMGSTATTYSLNAKSISELKYKSKHGNAEASLRLHQYYLFTLNDIDNQMYYLDKAAMQGSSIAQYNYAFFLSYNVPEYHKYYNLDKAIYWMDIAAKNGNIDAGNKLQELESIKKKK